MTEPIDGRRARGARKRAEIIDATLRVVEADGAASVTHRTVAASAGVPASSVTYHFATLDDLLVAALTTAVDTYADQLDGIVASGADPLEGLARLTAEARGQGRLRALAERELTLVAARRPALRPVARRWRDIVIAIALQHTSDPLAGETLLGVADSLCVRVLLGDDDLSVDRIHEHLRYALGLRSGSRSSGAISASTERHPR